MSYSMTFQNGRLGLDRSTDDPRRLALSPSLTVSCCHEVPVLEAALLLGLVVVRVGLMVRVGLVGRGGGGVVLRGGRGPEMGRAAGGGRV